jgi:putative membrane protein
MQDEAPEGQPQHPGDSGQPESPWWPWPETQADEPTGPRDGAPGVDETLSLPVEAPAVVAGDEPDADGAPSAVEDPEPAPPVDTEPEADTEPEEVPATSAASEVAVDPDLSPEVVPGGAAVALAESVTPRTAAVEAPRPPNEAIPAVPPTAGTGPIGSIPAAQARAVWSRLQASNWRLFLVRFLSAGLAVVATVVIVPGLGFTGWRWGDFIRIAFIFGLLNATVKPLLQFLVLRFIFSTYGIVVVIINVLLLLLLGAILDDTFVVFRPISLVVGGVVVGILGLVLETLLGATPPVLDRDYKERNGVR